jgi:hypothetical protein
MNSQELNKYHWNKQVNPSGEVIRTKTYHRTLLVFDNEPNWKIIKKRKQLAELLGINWQELMGSLDITVKIDRYPKDGHRFNKKVLEKFNK